MQYPSHAFDEVGAINIDEDLQIESFIEETMTFIKDESIEEPDDDAFPSSETSPEIKPLPSTLKYAFLEHQHTKPMIISSQLEKDQEEILFEVLQGRKEASNRMEIIGP